MDVKKGIKKLDIEEKARLLTGASLWYTPECPEIGLSSKRLSDGPHGLRIPVKSNVPSKNNSVPATCFPTASATASTFNPELSYGVGKRIAEEAAYFGVGMVLGPGVNVKRSPLCGRNFEYFSEDCYLSGKMGAAFIKGVQSKNVVACVKHFAVNCREYARNYYDSRVDEQTLREIYLTSFEIAVKEGKAGAVMTAYNKLNGEFCSENSFLLNGVLRGEWGFDGLTVTDWGGSSDKVKALKAGSDLEMPACKFTAPAVVEAVKNGELEEKIVDQSVARLHAFAAKADAIVRWPCDFKEHDEYAEKVAAESLVLLKNEDRLLPLRHGQKVAVIGDIAKNPRYQGAGSSIVNPRYLANIWGEIEKTDINTVGFARGYNRFGGKNESLAKQAIALAKKADVIVFCLGTDEDGECEGTDRKDLKINANQTELLERITALGKKVVAILCCGSAVETDWDRKVGALLLAHLSGQSGARAVVKALTGEVNPSGRLAETFPLKSGDEPCASVYAESPLKNDCAEGIYVGYRYYATFDVPVKYPFGYGLSYTSFAVTDCLADKGGVRCTVTNTGLRDGATVVQVYVKDCNRNLTRSPFELKIFQKVFLKAGQSKLLALPFDEYAFRRWSAENGRWEAGGRYQVSVSFDSLHSYFYGVINLKEEDVPQGLAYGEGSGDKLDYAEYFRRNITGDIPESKRGRLIADFNTPVTDLVRCKGLLGKFFGLLAKANAKSKDKVKASGMQWLSVRALMQFLELNPRQAEGFLLACNGRFLRGMKKLLFDGDKKR